MSEILITILLFLFAYVLGGVPFAYLFTKLFTKKDIMKIGWKKSSSSNVLTNVGKLPAFLTFFFDVFKGFIVVYIAKELGLSFEVQALAGFFAVAGHNWSIFLRFNGGRGIATILGACLAFNLLIGIVILIPVILTSLVWTGSIGTIIGYFSGMIWGYMIQDYGLFLLFLICLIPIALKRLSPKETLKGNVINRLVFDQDNVPPLRIRRK